MNSHNYRRTWDFKEYQKKTVELNQESKKRKIESEEITREPKLRKITKPKIEVGKVTLSKKNEFYCSLCDTSNHDSLSYLSHLNSRNHQKNLNIDLTKNQQKSTLLQVRERLKKVEKPKPNVCQSKNIEAKKIPNNGSINLDPEELKMISLMGFSSFGTSKKH